VRKVVELTRADGIVVCEHCLVADSPLARMRGLLGREELPRGEGMLLRPAASVHTAFMRFAIDVVFLDDGGRVLKVAHSLAPSRAVACRGASMAVELAAGECSRLDIQAGDMLELSPFRATLGARDARDASPAQF
jgi:uncharacterized membrane protein (UPF0127 family)